MTKDIEFRISVTGDLGSGKSTVCKILAERMKAEIVSIGTINRKMAMEMNMDAVEFNKFIVGKPEFDKIFDDYQRAYEDKEGNYIVDSRLGFHFVPSTYSFYLKVDIGVAAQRIMSAQRTSECYASVDEAITKINERRQAEQIRYSQCYNVDILNMDNYDCVIDTTNLTPDQVAEEMIKKYLEYKTEAK